MASAGVFLFCVLLLPLLSARNCAAVGCPASAGLASCDCTEVNPGKKSVVCMNIIVATVLDELRMQGLAGNVTQMTITDVSDRELSGSFHGFVSLDRLEIVASSLSAIEPGVFSGLAHLRLLDLRDNNLQWLTGSMFSGIGNQLETLRLDRNQIRYLSGDLEPIFRNISIRITLYSNELDCDCHLQWLASFTADPSPPAIEGAECSNSSQSIDDANVDFSHCQDLCSLGLDLCDENATCSAPSGPQDYTCACNAGFMGNGTSCLPVLVLKDSCDLVCGDTERCVFESFSQCVCTTGYVLVEGGTCAPRASSMTVCNGETALGYVWPNTTAGTTVRLSCATDQSAMSVTRECGSDGEWGVLNAPNCISWAVLGLRAQLSLLTNDSNSDPQLNDFTSQLLNVTMTTNFSGDVPEIVDIIQAAVELLALAPPTGQDIPDSFDNLVMTASELLEEENHRLWQQLPDSLVAHNLVGLFGSMNNLGTTVLDRSDSMNVTIKSNNIALVVVRPFNSSDGSCSEEEVVISSSLLASMQGVASSLHLPPTLFNDTLGHGFQCADVGIVAVVYNRVGGVIEETESIAVPTDRCSIQLPQLNSIILSAVVVNSSEAVNTTVLSRPITITLQHDDTSLEQPTCAFLNEQELQGEMSADERWLTGGCSVLSRMANQTVCQCFHLTSFALLMSPRGPRTAPDRPLQIASKVGLSLSIICLLATIILLFSLKLESNKLHHIHRQLALALCLSQVIFLVAVDRTLVPSPDWVCTTIAAFLHYFLLATFAWQLIEGLHLYLMIVRVFYNKKIVWFYYPFAWGTPLIIVGVTVGVRLCDYTSEFYCWITIVRGTIWAFLGPVIAVVAINTVILVVIVFIIVRSARKHDENACIFFTLLHASLVLVPILGITWILGFFVVGEDVVSTIIEWLFFAFTTLQGVAIFTMHCVVKKEVRSALLKALGCHDKAKKQTTLMAITRRISRSSLRSRSSTSSLQPMAHRKKSRPDDITSFKVHQGGLHFPRSLFSKSLIIARPPLSARNEVFSLNDIQEESDIDSLPSSAAATPQLPHSHHP